MLTNNNCATRASNRLPLALSTLQVKAVISDGNVVLDVAAAFEKEKFGAIKTLAGNCGIVVAICCRVEKVVVQFVFH
jgi:hypothetical protein